jgi:hypothetical protein
MGRSTARVSRYAVTVQICSTDVSPRSIVMLGNMIPMMLESSTSIAIAEVAASRTRPDVVTEVLDDR